MFLTSLKSSIIILNILYIQRISFYGFNMTIILLKSINKKSVVHDKIEIIDYVECNRFVSFFLFNYNNYYDKNEYERSK